MDDQLEQQMAAYIEGNLSTTERQEFEQLMLENPELHAEVHDLLELQTGLEAVGYQRFKDEVQGWEQQISTARNFRWRPLAVAAVIALLIVPAIFWFQQGPSNEDLFLAYYEPYEEQLLSRGLNSDSIQSSSQDALIKGLEAYNQGAYKRSSNLLGNYLESQPQDHRVALYLAITQLELGQAQEAELNFERARKDPDFEQQAIWYQALSYLKFGESTKLTEITGRDYHYRKEQAAALLGEL